MSLVLILKELQRCAFPRLHKLLLMNQKMFSNEHGKVKDIFRGSKDKIVELAKKIRDEAKQLGVSVA